MGFNAISAGGGSATLIRKIDHRALYFELEIYEYVRQICAQSMELFVGLRLWVWDHAILELNTKIDLH